MVTVTGPVIAPYGTVAMSLVSEVIVRTVARTPPKVTAIALVKPVPVTLTGVPRLPSPA